MTGGSENDNVPLGLEEVPCTPSIFESVSTITDTLGLHTVLERPLNETNIGLPRTSEVNILFIFDASLDDCGELGLVCNTPEMEPDTNVEETEVVAGGLEVENGNTNHEQGTALTNEIIDSMIVKDLKDALGTRNLFKVGVKVVLVARLKEAVDNGLTRV